MTAKERNPRFSLFSFFLSLSFSSFLFLSSLIGSSCIRKGIFIVTMMDFVFVLLFFDRNGGGKKLLLRFVLDFLFSPPLIPLSLPLSPFLTSDIWFYSYDVVFRPHIPRSPLYLRLKKSVFQCFLLGFSSLSFLLFLLVYLERKVTEAHDGDG